MGIDLSYTLGRAAPQGNGIGYEIVRRTSEGDARLVALQNIGSSLANEFNGMLVAKGEQLLFRFHTDGDPGGDITRVGIVIRGGPAAAVSAIAPTPASATVTAGSDLRLTGPATAGESAPWFKDGQPIAGATGRNHQIVSLKASDAGSYSVSSAGTTSAAAACGGRPPHARARAPLGRTEVWPLGLAATGPPTVAEVGARVEFPLHIFVRHPARSLVLHPR